MIKIREVVSIMSKNEEKQGGILGAIERAGNKLPHPVTIFLILTFTVMVFSWILSSIGTSAVHPGTGETIEIVNLLSKDGLQWVLGSITGNFQNYPPLGLVLIVMLGAGLADKTGLMNATIKNSVMQAPDKLVTAIVMFIGINAVAVGDAGFVVLPPLAAAIFLGMGRNPLAGIFLAYGAVAGGFAASLMVQMGDVVVASFTVPAAQMMDPTYSAGPAMNYYFMIASTFVIMAAGIYVNDKIVEPRLGKYEGEDVDSDALNEPLTDLEKKGLKRAGYSVVAIILAVVALSIGDGAFMKDPETNSLFGGNAPLMTGIVPLVTFIFLVPGYIYGKAVGTIKSDQDAIRMMGEAVGEMGGYIVLVAASSQFLAMFNQSKIGPMLSIKGANFLENVGMTGIGAIIAFIFVAALLNIFMGSAGAKWGILAPVFIPMFMILGYDPAVTQVAYRIGDSLTNAITPLASYFPLVLGLIQQYDEDEGMGSVIANMLPYSAVFALVWVVLLVGFMVFDLPLGPGGGIYL